jgi:hypothetical protein
LILWWEDQLSRISTLMRPSDWGEAYDQSLSTIGKREGIALISCTVAL